MSKIRVLTVDDSIVVRRCLAMSLADDPALELAGAAPSGRIALAKLEQLTPDVVVLDVEMPELDGVQTLAEIRRKRPHLPVIFFSSVSPQVNAKLAQVLTQPNVDFVAKPANCTNAAAALQYVQDKLLPRLRAISSMTANVAERVPLTPTTPVRGRTRIKPSRIDVVAIGVSTGGPSALAAVIPRLPVDLPVPVLIVQHMPATFTKHLSERLNTASQLAVREARDGDKLRPGEVLIAPGDYHLTVVKRGTDVLAKLGQGPPENSCRPAVDPLFTSVVAAYGPHALCLVLTGMGQDGLRGAQAAVDAGARVMVQDEASCVVWGMPRAVAEAGLAERRIPLLDLAPTIVSLVGEGRTPARPATSGRTS